MGGNSNRRIDEPEPPPSLYSRIQASASGVDALEWPHEAQSGRSAPSEANGAPRRAILACYGPPADSGGAKTCPESRQYARSAPRPPSTLLGALRRGGRLIRASAIGQHPDGNSLPSGIHAPSNSSRCASPSRSSLPKTTILPDLSICSRSDGGSWDQRKRPRECTYDEPIGAAATGHPRWPIRCRVQRGVRFPELHWAVIGQRYASMLSGVRRQGSQRLGRRRGRPRGSPVHGSGRNRSGMSAHFSTSSSAPLLLHLQHLTRREQKLRASRSTL